MSERLGSAVTVPVATGEAWWGGVAADGLAMPFRDGYRADLRDLGGNQGMPLLLSSHGRTVWSDRPFAFEVAHGALHIRTDPAAGVVLAHDQGDLAGAYRSLARTHFPPRGRTPDPLLFTAPQYNLWIETLFHPTQQGVLDYARAVLEHGLPPGVLMIDDQWHEAYGTWSFHSGRFPDPAGMIAELHELGFTVMLWLVPYVTPDSEVFRALRSAGLLVRDGRGRVAVGEWWNGFGAALDLLNPDARRWLSAALGELTQLGVDGFKFDGGEPPFYAAIGCADPHAYTVAWNQFGLRYRLNEFRDAWLAASLPLAQRQRDKRHAWQGSDGLAALVPNALAQSLTGHAYICPDMIGGGEYQSFGSATFDPELFVRSAQASALFPMMQFSAAPWRLLDAEHLGYCRDAARLHERLGPEILALAEESARTGEPIIRPLEFDHPGHGYAPITDQFLLGPDILVAPVTEPGATSRRVTVPPGRWRADDDGQEIEGPTTVEVAAPLARLPWFRRVPPAPADT
ncbi:glycoside hydrolase family 31 protein [Streptomyces sp. DSM 44915]|uniref:Glycoside hydrolase family 31 protein n=1 Tax=Streptomyces chisholmiae TaxID=3075540 RepID=A0ABU2JW03_9ACTN|nr:glycoside hydrolase family 31 protein [Streptomyces sp. DSM 44915]MDT0269047.1 glycoside hydrolase family 31 protein [Streptomyces sp. DSM 44915]